MSAAEAVGTRAVGWRSRLGSMCALFGASAIALALEILCPRLLAPVHGSGHVVWSSVVTVTLVAFALGYWRGGIIADGPRSRGSLAACLAVAAVWLIVVHAIRGHLLLWLVPLGPAVAPLATASAVLFVPLACLAAVYPIVVRRLTTEVVSVGRSVGTASGVSTFGSIVGSLATAFVLVPRFGVGELLAGCSALLFIGALFALPRRRPLPVATLVAGAAWSLVSSSDFRAVLPEGVVHFENSVHSTILVQDDETGGLRTLYLDSVAHSAVHVPSLESPGQTLLALELPMFMRPEAREVVVIGLGAGVLPRVLHENYGAEVHSVEIDAAVVRVARQYFGFPLELPVAVEDGRTYLRNRSDALDLIVLDAAAGDSHPFHLYTAEAFALYASRLGRRGILAINLIASASSPAGVRSANAILCTLRTCFAHAAIFRSELSSVVGVPWQTYAVFASAAPLEFERDPSTGREALARYHMLTRTRPMLARLGEGAPGDGDVVLTDDRSTLDHWSAALLLSERSSRLRALDERTRTQLGMLLRQF